ncbi:hypothetical protein [Streptomyces sp. NPDC090025]|uniref:hypothetical protein n=1 Tax=Streptomyces sp. NPDC090025 TaxID=3365922 RepID=UPI0038376D3B
MTNRRSLGAGPQDLAGVRAAQADLLAELPGVRLPDIDDLRTRGVLGAHRTDRIAGRRALGDGVARTAANTTGPEDPNNR